MPKNILGYLVAGLAAVGTHLLVLHLLVRFGGLAPTLSSAIGFIAAIPVNYWLQYHYAFRSNGEHRQELPRYLVLVSFSLGLNTVLFALLEYFLPLPYVVVQVIVIGALVVFNYFAGRRFVFKNASQ